jgi:hypothetical protein
MSRKPSESEDEYFARLEFERRKHEAREREGKAAETERQKVLAVAKGRCPKCGAPLVALQFRNVEIDKCSNCGGVWLDTGELEAITPSDDKGFLGSVKRIFG